MRRICFGLLAVLFTGSLHVNAQVVWTGKTKVFIGDSNTEGVYDGPTRDGYDSYGTNRFSSLLSSMKGSNEDNKGVRGMVVQDAVSGTCTTTKATESFIPAKDADHLFLYIMLGSNDIAYNNGSFTAAGFQTRYDQLVADAIAKGWPATSIILISPPWKPVGSLSEPGDKSSVSGAYDVFYDYCGVTNRVDEARQQSYVNAVQAVAAARSTMFVDLYTAMKNHPDRLSFLSHANGGFDRMHLSIAGHQFVANTLANLAYEEAALPLTLIEFTATKNDKSTHLRWVSDNEVNTKEFIIERSENGLPFQPIGLVKASGNTGVQHTYEFTDNNPFYGSNHYRLKMIDLDDRFEYSKTTVIEISNSLTFAIYPNPARTHLEIRRNGQEPVQIHIADINGKTVHQEYSASRVLSLDISQLQRGVYIINVKGTNETHTQKLIIH